VRHWIGIQRPTRNSRFAGYILSLEKQLTNQIPKKYMQKLIENHLDTTKCASAQSAALLKVVCNKVTAAISLGFANDLIVYQALDEFPDLENYSNSWPASDMIMTRLKYTSGRARRKEGEMALGKGRSREHQSEA